MLPRRPWALCDRLPVVDAVEDRRVRRLPLWEGGGGVGLEAAWSGLLAPLLLETLAVRLSWRAGRRWRVLWVWLLGARRGSSWAGRAEAETDTDGCSS